MAKCFFVSDIHGSLSRYKKLINLIRIEKPEAVFVGGDLLPHMLRNSAGIDDFIYDFLFPSFESLKKELGNDYPEIFLILGNDDARSEEQKMILGDEREIWHYSHFQWKSFNDYQVCGYSFVPPTPFQIKDWEKYDVSRYVDPGCIPPTEGFRTVEPEEDIEYATIQKDLELLSQGKDPGKSIFLFHSPPYKTDLYRAGLDGMMIDHIPLDVHVGSIAMQKFIEDWQPHITMHGHIHESTRLTGNWKQKIGKTVCFNASHDGSELSVIKLDLDDPENSGREIL
ncbi:MAG: metallophosphoesterase [Bacteroidales bacterium]|nr:metallophosphoesterase [Bacteroidales bacterium]